MSQPAVIPEQNYSTIFNCDESGLVCLLRGLEGVICCITLYFFVRGYMHMNKRKLIVNEDKEIYLLSLAQVLLLAIYYLLFEEFFLLATIRNLLLWTDLLILSNLCQIHFARQPTALERCNLVITLLRGANFVLWIYIAVVEGTTITNTTFNVGYNCLIPDWMVLSGSMFAVSLLCVFVGLQIYDKLEWEGKNLNKAEEVRSTQQTILIFMVTTAISSFMMFVWDFIAHLHSHTEQDCVDMFSGDTFSRNILFFVLKIITMQVQPLGIYYTTYYKVVRDNPDDQEDQFNPDAVLNEMDLIVDDAPSELNNSMFSRGSSRASLHSNPSRQNLLKD